MSSTEGPVPIGLLDTSVFIASESGRALDRSRLPAKSAVSVVTVGELHAGVLGAVDPTDRARRLRSYNDARYLEPIPIDTDVADSWAELRQRLLLEGLRMGVNDSWIAATAIAHGIPIVTQDGDFAEGLGFEIIRV